METLASRPFLTLALVLVLMAVVWLLARLLVRTAVRLLALGCLASALLLGLAWLVRQLG